MLASGEDLLLADPAHGAIKRFNELTGAFLGTFVSSNGMSCYGMAYGTDGNLYAGDFAAGQVRKYDGLTGAFVGVFAQVYQPYDLAFGPDGNLYVISGSQGVQKFNGTTGASLGNFITPPGSSTPVARGLVFHGSFLYVTYLGLNAGALYKYEASSGALMSNVYSAFSGNGPRNPRFGPDGHLYVPDWQTPYVYKFDGANDTLLTKLTTGSANSVSFGPGANLNVLIDEGDISLVRRYDLHTGAFVGTLIPAGTAGISRAFTLTPSPPNAITLYPFIQTTFPPFFSFTFTTVPGRGFEVLTTTSPASPLSSWDYFGPVYELSPGQYAFSDRSTANTVQRYYRVRGQ